MTAPAAISGDFATYRHVQGRKVLQLVIEVPAESAAAVFAALGTPGTGEGIPVALARLAKSTTSKMEAVQKPRTAFSDLPYSQQAAMRCNEPEFWAFLRSRGSVGVVNSEDAAQPLRNACGVSSRSDIVKGTAAGRNWEELEADYFAWSRGMR